MGRTVGKLTALKVDRLKAAGLYPDGAGLYLQVTGDGQNRVSKSWIYRYTLRGVTRDMGLGSFVALGLADARTEAARWRRVRQEGRDPIEARKAERARAAVELAMSEIFTGCRKKYIEAHRDGWRNAKHAAQWQTTLETYAEPVIGQLPVQTIDTAMVLKVLEPIWSTKTETASRVRGRIEAILDWARVRGYRQGENPARWKGHLDQMLPRRSKVRPVEHHAALPCAELGGFMAKLRAENGTAARALEFAILTAARTGEAIGATWSEINLAEKTWTIPGSRMKAGREHRVPLAPRTVKILEALKTDPAEGFVFPGDKPGRPLSNMALLMLLRRMGRDDVTAHGFRSTFRDWCAERTSYPSEVAEMALAHVVGDKVEAAYRRGDMFEKRRRLAEEWATFCASGKATGGKVVPMQRRG